MNGSQQRDRASARWALGAFVSYCLVALPAVSHSYSSGPPDAKTGAPGDGTCLECHNSFPLNSGPGVLTISAPGEFEAGQAYPIVVTLEQAGQSRWGFEATPLDLGACTVTDPQNTQSSTSGIATYVKHTAQGTYSGSAGPAVWTFDWTAPQDPPDEVVFYAAGNAADGNGVTSGDYIYTTFATSVLAPAGADDGPGAPVLDVAVRGTPNPIRESATISYSVPARSAARLTIHDVAGRLITELFRGDAQPGTHHVEWEGTDGEGRGVPGGLYFCRLAAAGRAETARLVLVR
jgi:hypothetical protein